jgi:hypothetical protein
MALPPPPFRMSLPAPPFEDRQNDDALANPDAIVTAPSMDANCARRQALLEVVVQVEDVDEAELRTGDLLVSACILLGVRSVELAADGSDIELASASPAETEPGNSGRSRLPTMVLRR